MQLDGSTQLNVSSICVQTHKQFGIRNVATRYKLLCCCVCVLVYARVSCVYLIGSGICASCVSCVLCAYLLGSGVCVSCVCMCVVSDRQWCMCIVCMHVYRVRI